VDKRDSIQARLDAKIFSLFALNRAAQILTSVLDLKSLAEMAVDAEIEMAGAKSGALYLAGHPGGPFVLAAAKSLAGEQFPAELPGDELLERKVDGRKSWPFFSAVLGTERSGLLVPVRLREIPVGFFILLERVKAEPWDDDDMEVLATLSSQVAACVQNARLYHQVVEQYEALKAAQCQLIQAEKLATMGTLLAGVAHELNNPLSVVVGQTALLSEEVGAEPLRERAEKITVAAERCARIVRNFLALARQHPPERQRVSINQLVNDVVEMLAYPLRVDNIETIVNLPADIPFLWVDPHQLQQVLVNLVSNAHQAMRQTPPPRRVILTTRYEPVRARVQVEVADTGPGIPPEIQSQVFDPFFTTKPPGEGTGLGLTICHGIIEAHRGSLRVTSPPGQGAVFLIELPLNVWAAVEPEGRATEMRAVEWGKRILLVDDEPEILALLADLLSGEGCEVDTAANGTIALDKLGERTYDAIVSDVRMPELDGPGLWRELERRHPELLPHLVFVTGDTLGKEVAEFLERTRALSLTKPFVLDELRRVIQRAL
jgi:signal transduction histidine kinase